MTKKFVVWFKEVDKEDIDIVGGKGANLGEMTKAGFPVPPGFIVTADAYSHFLDVTGLRDDLERILRPLDVSNSKALEEASQEINKLITRSQFPSEIAEPIQKAYFQMDEGLVKHAHVAVRSSATAEDLPGASFAGQQATFLNVHGEANLIEKVKEAWASLFTARAIFYRVTNKFDHFKVKIAVPVEKMISSDVSGVMFTIDPVTNNKKTLVIEAILGLGEMIVQGSVTPDHYVIDKTTDAIVQKEVNTQEKQMLYRNGKNVIEALHKTIGSKQKLDDANIKKLALLGKKLDKHYFFPQDIEWALDQGKLYILQTRPVTTTGKVEKSTARVERNVLLKGDAASPGVATGPVKILRSPKELSKVKSGDILVAEMTNPDYVPAMRKAVAIITERGGRTSHAAIVSRELGIPAIVGAVGVMKTLKDGLVVTVDGSRGEIFKGALVKPNLPKETNVSNARIKTATKVYVNLAEPSRAREIAKMHVDGVGLLRAEFMIAGIGTHPKKMIKDRKQKVFMDTLSDQLETFCSAFGSRPVVYRATDFKTNEYRSLKGGKEFEPEEPNPMLGYRGAVRYIGTPEVFELELEAIKEVRNKRGHKNLWLMIPFVRTPKELLDVKKIVVGSGLARSPSFQIWMMVEIPTNVIRLEEFLDVGIDGVSIGSNDLTMLLLGTDRDNSDVSHDFSEMDPSVLWAIERVIKICHKHRVTSSICGQAPSDYPDLVDKLVKWGITSVSVNPDAVSHVRETIRVAESKL